MNEKWQRGIGERYEGRRKYQTFVFWEPERSVGSCLGSPWAGLLSRSMGCLFFWNTVFVCFLFIVWRLAFALFITYSNRFNPYDCGVRVTERWFLASASSEK